MSERESIFDIPIDIELNSNQMPHLENVMNQESNDELNQSLIRECLKVPVIA